MKKTRPEIGIDDILTSYRDELKQWIVTTDFGEMEEKLFVDACAHEKGVLPVKVQDELDRAHPHGETGYDFLTICVDEYEILPQDMKDIIENYIVRLLLDVERLEYSWKRSVSIEEAAAYRAADMQKKRSLDMWK